MAFIPILLMLLILLLLLLLLLVRFLFHNALNNTSGASLSGDFYRQKIERKEKTVEYLRMREKIDRGEIREGMTFEQFSNAWESSFPPSINAEINSESGSEVKFEYFAWNTASGDSLGTILLDFQSGILKKIQVMALPGLEDVPDDTEGAVDNKA